MVCAFSFCLYNPPNALYYNGLLENIVLINKHFPYAFIYVYVGNDVPEYFLLELSARNVIVRFTYETGAVNMIHRFFAIDGPEVDIMFVRDADSRVHWKDRWAIQEFMNTPSKKLHIVRDNPQHNTAIMGGVWGMRKVKSINIRTLYDEYKTKSNKDYGVGIDQNFLRDCVYTKLWNSAMIHSSQDWKLESREDLVPFPFPYTNDIYCGRIEGPDYVDLPMPSYIILPALTRPIISAPSILDILNRKYN